jgi:hypothetical protein
MFREAARIYRFVVGAATRRPFVARAAGRQVADDRVPQHQQPSAIGS